MSKRLRARLRAVAAAVEQALVAAGILAESDNTIVTEAGLRLIAE